MPNTNYLQIADDEASTTISQSVATEGVGFVDGKIVPIAEARIPILDRGFIHSDATYDVVHVWENHFFRLDDHLDRFMNGIDRLHMSIDYTREDIKKILARCVVASGLKSAYVEMICTRGVPDGNSRDPRRCTNAFYAFVVPFSWVATPEEQKKGVRLHISKVERISPQSVDPTIKNYHWLDLVRGQYDAFDADADLAVLTDRHGNIVEGAGFNVFTVKGDTVATPGTGVLKGITRKTAIELCAQLGLAVQERDVPTADVLSADEVFLTTTAGGIIPVRYVNDRKIGNGGSTTSLRLRDLYWEAHRDPRLSVPVSV
ncbi:aminotransferase class IV [Allopusillimonas ginsengisoli]|uniref:aminotransferase class IV n=1 Tax=Allopusillimonas ginsengisoli TaxID=453575 RepID=UPI0010224C89|nr:aminotransferase class IV [Allopusillimonas ginsengisoli]TEA79020.1 branched-chain amino acid transferase [Allopusillimonas ginsengisoli]